VLALAGTISVLTSKAVYGYVDTVDLADGSRPVLPRLARAYTDAAPIGDVTNAARLTVLRDAVWLAALTAVCLVMITPVQRGFDATRTASCASPNADHPLTSARRHAHGRRPDSSRAVIYAEGGDAAHRRACDSAVGRSWLKHGRRSASRGTPE
jgi:hypothetical protein